MFANGVVGSGTAVARFMAWHTNAIESVFRFGTLGDTVLTIFDVHTFRTIVRTGAGARKTTFRIAFAAMFCVHLIDVRLTVATIQTGPIKFEMFTLKALAWARSPTARIRAFGRTDEAIGIYN